MMQRYLKMFYRHSNLGLLVLTSVGAMGRCLFFFKIITVHAGFFHSLGIKEPPVPFSFVWNQRTAGFGFKRIFSETEICDWFRLSKKPWENWKEPAVFMT